MTVLKAGYGITIGQDFCRARKDMPIEITETRGSDVYGYVDMTDTYFPNYGTHAHVRTITKAIETV